MTTESKGAAAVDVEELLLRIARLEDEREILDTLHRYGQMIDYGRDRDWAELFTEDGEFLCVDHTGKEILREKGRDALAKWARSFAAGETLRMKHCVIAPVITVDGDTARVESYFSNLVENEDRQAAPQIRYMGRYSDELVREADGRWRLRRRISMSEAPLPDSENALRAAKSL
jgi:ketosteroid isomerase-like protein